MFLLLLWLLQLPHIMPLALGAGVFRSHDSNACALMAPTAMRLRHAASPLLALPPLHPCSSFLPDRRQTGQTAKSPNIIRANKSHAYHAQLQTNTKTSVSLSVCVWVCACECESACESAWRMPQVAVNSSQAAASAAAAPTGQSAQRISNLSAHTSVRAEWEAKKFATSSEGCQRSLQKVVKTVERTQVRQMKCIMHMLCLPTVSDELWNCLGVYAIWTAWRKPVMLLITYVA